MYQTAWWDSVSTALLSLALHLPHIESISRLVSQFDADYFSNCIYFFKGIMSKHLLVSASKKQYVDIT